MGRLDGKVAFITGAARGQGRSHAIRFAQEGADIIAIDVCERIPENPYNPATEEDLAETVRQVEALDRRIMARKADVRDWDQVKSAVDDGVAELGRLDIVSANAGISGRPNVSEEIPDDEFTNMIDINLTGVWRSAKAAIPHLRAAGGGSIVITSSDAGLFAYPNISHYVSAKHGVIGLMRTLALELAPAMIRVNAICPTTVDTDMVQNQAIYSLFRPDLENATKQDFADAAIQMNALPIPWVESIDISNALLFLASDEARYITGVALPVDAGAAVK
ncbi:(+)-trans-carveol dehydrogenase/(-)-trans-carveol dehydrogenase [Microbacterium sp. AK009]|uniref:mycofactocin-coupled SDR family oxidoreductase n=1 Tax=Microbacterium sp. AK009 TaxID=2723068 RepID=UPI0015CBD8E9|nr:mycofactocin-coupled SDR family oxidoreductase [Microbacterium sp. AK009]NYF15488.1 (+)-trans-carveol dehydrogenase/(-)-trans-carveol dehydrogenase [Microbacterium sp. AK009]